MSCDLPPAAREEIRRGRILGAIKIVRRETGLDLKASKQAVDAYLNAHPELTSRSAAGPVWRSLVWLLLQIAVLFGLYRWLVR